MALIKCPECEKNVSSQASNCPNCGYPIASRPKTVKIRCLSDDMHVRRMRFKVNGKIVEEPIGSVAVLTIEHPTTVHVEVVLGFISGSPTSFTAVPGKCYEVRYCKPGFAFWETKVSEVSIV